MAYTKTAWVEGGAPGITAANLNKIEQGIADAHNNFLAKSGGTMSGSITFASNMYWLNSTPKFALDLSNGDIIGVNAILMNDTSDGNEGVGFIKDGASVDSSTSSDYNFLKIDGAGVGWVGPNKIWTDGNDSALAKTSNPVFTGTLKANSMENTYGYFKINTYSETNYGVGHSQFWYNPNDKRLNIEYRDGAGANVTSELYSSGNKVWTAGNDGSGSGLDADLLDGNHASVFLKLSGGTLTGDLQSASSTSGAILDSFFNIKRKTGSSGSWNILNDVGSSLFRVSWDGTGALLQKGLIIDNVDDVSETDTDGLTIRGAAGKLQIDDNEILSVDTNNNLKNLILSASSATLNGKYVYAAGLNVTWGTAAPSGGGNGDIYIQY